MLTIGRLAGHLPAETASTSFTIFSRARLLIGLGSGSYSQLILGGGAAAAMWALIGLGVGAVVRSQVPAVVALCAWLLFVEGLIAGDVPSVSRFFPAALARALAGSQSSGTLRTSAVAALVLALYAALAVAAGRSATTRRDVA